MGLRWRVSTCRDAGATGRSGVPFCFRLPDSYRYILPRGDHDSTVGLLLLKDPWLRIGWQLGAGMQVPSNLGERTLDELLLNKFVSRCIQESRDTFLEYALWKALTDTTLDACCQHPRASVESFLEQVNDLLVSRALPVRLPEVADTPLLCRWITDVLLPLTAHWQHIQCAECKRRAREAGAIQVQITGMTSAGSILGQMTCTRCNVSRAVTVLTHCHKPKCHHYPLIIGKNPVCPACGGLVCEWRGDDGADRCKACKMNCGEGEHTSEEAFV